MFTELPAFNPDPTSLVRRKCYVNLQQVAGIAKLTVNGQSQATNGMPVPIALGEAWQFQLVGGGQVLVDASADIAGIVERANAIDPKH